MQRALKSISKQNYFLVIDMFLYKIVQDFQKQITRCWDGFVLLSYQTGTP